MAARFVRAVPRSGGMRMPGLYGGGRSAGGNPQKDPTTGARPPETGRGLV
jgi:hypothetical protein